MKETTYLELITRLFNDSGIRISITVLDKLLIQAKTKIPRGGHSFDWLKSAFPTWDRWIELQIRPTKGCINQLAILYLIELVLGSRNRAYYVYNQANKLTCTDRNKIYHTTCYTIL